MRTRNVVLSCLLFVCFAVFPINAQELYDNEIIIIVKEGTVQMPLGATTAAVEDVTFNPPGIKQTLLTHSAETVTVAFPDYDPADTIFTTRMGNTITRKFDLHLVYKIYLTDAQQRGALNGKLEAYDEILSSQNNGTSEPFDEPYFPSQWGLHNEGQSGGVSDVDIDAPEAWQHETGEQTIVIGIADTGVDLDHIELNGKVSGESYTYDGHGTHVAGIAGAWGNNGVGIAGVNWNGHMVSKKTIGADYIGIWDRIADLLHYNTLEVINCSWGLTEGDVVLMHRLFAFVYNVGVASVAARANDGNTEPRYPACFGDWMISVGAHTDMGGRANYSSYGGGMDFLAPGGNGGDQDSDIISTWPNDYLYWDHGTSMAAPHVTGIVSLIHDYTDLRLSDEFEEILKKSCDPAYGPGYDELSGWGRVNANSALELVTFPQEIYRYESSLAEPYQQSYTYPYILTCWDWPSLPGSGNYMVRRYEVRGDVNFEDDLGTHFGNTPILVPTGYFSGFEPTPYGVANYGVRYCKPDPNTLDGNGATLVTYVYEVWSLDPDPIPYGFVPCAPEDVTFQYTVIGNAAPAVPTGLSVSPSPDFHPYVQWDHNTEGDLNGYKVYRMVHGIEEDWVHIATVPAGNNRYEDTEYSTPHPGPYAMWTDDADYSVSALDQYAESDMAPFVTIVVVVPARPYPTPSKQAAPVEKIPEDFALSPAYPNPFNARTTIEYALPEDSYVKIDIFNVSGQKIKTLVSEHRPAGYHMIIWDASDISSGVYLYRIEAGDFEETKSITLLK